MIEPKPGQVVRVGDRLVEVAKVLANQQGDRVAIQSSDGTRYPLSEVSSPELPPVRPNRPGSTWLYDPMPEVGDRVVIRNLTQCLKRHPRLSLDLQCAVYEVVRLNDDGTVSLTSDYGDARYPADWLGVMP
jgi:hypothetical protein